MADTPVNNNAPSLNTFLDDYVLLQAQAQSQNFIKVGDEEALFAPKPQTDAFKLMANQQTQEQLRVNKSVSQVTQRAVTEMQSNPLYYNTTINPNSEIAKQITDKLFADGVITMDMPPAQMVQKIHQKLGEELLDKNLSPSTLVNLEAAVTGQALLQSGQTPEQVQASIKVVEGTTLFGDYDARMVYTDAQNQQVGYSYQENVTGYTFNDSLYTNIQIRNVDFNSFPVMPEEDALAILAAAPPPEPPPLYTSEEIPLSNLTPPADYENAHEYIQPNNLDVQNILHQLFPDGVNNLSDEEVYAAVHNYMLNNYQYIPDQAGDTWATPSEIIARGGGDCEDLANLEASLLVGALGPDAGVQVVAVRPNGETGPGHVLVLFTGNDGTVRSLDPTDARHPINKLSDAPVFDASKYEVFFVSDAHQTTILRNTTGLRTETDTDEPPVTTTSGDAFDALINGANNGSIDDIEGDIDNILHRFSPPPIPPVKPVKPTEPIKPADLPKDATAADKAQYKKDMEAYTKAKALWDSGKPMADYNTALAKYNVDKPIYDRALAAYQAQVPKPYLTYQAPPPGPPCYVVPDGEAMANDIKKLMLKMQRMASLLSVANTLAKLMEKIMHKVSGKEQSEDDKKVAESRDKVAEKFQDFMGKVSQCEMTYFNLFVQYVLRANSAAFESEKNRIEEKYAGMESSLEDMAVGGGATIKKMQELSTAADKYAEIMTNVLNQMKSAFMAFGGLDIKDIQFDPDSEDSKSLKAKYDALNAKFNQVFTQDLWVKDDHPVDKNGDPIKDDNGQYYKFRDDLMLEAYASFDLMNAMIRGYFTARETETQIYEFTAEALEQTVDDRSGKVDARKMATLAGAMLDQKMNFTTSLLGQIKTSAKMVVQGKNIANTIRIQTEKIKNSAIQALKTASFWLGILAIIAAFIPVIGWIIAAVLGVVAAVLSVVANGIQAGIEQNTPQMASLNQSFVDSTKMSEILDKFYGRTNEVPGPSETQEEKQLRETRMKERRLMEQLYNLRGSGMINAGGGRVFADELMIAEIENSLKNIQERQRNIYLMAKMTADILSTVAAEVSGGSKHFAASAFTEGIISTHFAAVDAMVDMLKFTLEQIEWANNLNIGVQNARFQAWMNVGLSLVTMIPLIGSTLTNLITQSIDYAFNPNNARNIDTEKLRTGSQSTWANISDEELAALERSDNDSDREKAILIRAARTNQLRDTGGRTILLQGDSSTSTGVDYGYFNTQQKALEQMALQRSMKVMLQGILVDLMIAACSSIKGGGASLSVGSMASNAAIDTADRASMKTMNTLNTVKQFQEKLAQAKNMKFEAKLGLDKALMSLVIITAAVAAIIAAPFVPVVGFLLLPLAIAAIVFNNVVTTSIYVAQSNDAKAQEAQYERQLLTENHDSEEAEIYNEAFQNTTSSYGAPWSGFGGMYVNTANMTRAEFRLMLLNIHRKAILEAAEAQMNLMRDFARDMGANPASSFGFEAMKSFVDYKRNSTEAMLKNIFSSLETYVNREMDLVRMRREMIMSAIDTVIQIIGLVAGGKSGGKASAKTGAAAKVGENLGKSKPTPSALTRFGSAIARSAVIDMVLRNLIGIVTTVINAVYADAVSQARSKARDTAAAASVGISGGWEGMTALTDIQLDTAKIDKQLIQEIATANRAIVEQIVNALKSELGRIKGKLKKQNIKDGHQLVQASSRTMKGSEQLSRALDNPANKEAAIAATQEMCKGLKQTGLAFQQTASVGERATSDARSVLTALRSAVSTGLSDTRDQVRTISDAEAKGTAIDSFAAQKSEVAMLEQQLDPAKKAEILTAVKGQAAALGITITPTTTCSEIYSGLLSGMQKDGEAISVEASALETKITGIIQDDTLKPEAKQLQIETAKAESFGKISDLQKAQADRAGLMSQLKAQIDIKPTLIVNIKGYVQHELNPLQERDLTKVAYHIREGSALSQLTMAMNLQDIGAAAVTATAGEAAATPQLTPIAEMKKKVMQNLLSSLYISPNGQMGPQTHSLMESLLKQVNELSHTSQQGAFNQVTDAALGTTFLPDASTLGDKLLSLRSDLCASKDKAESKLGALMLLEDETLGPKLRLSLIRDAFTAPGADGEPKVDKQALSGFFSQLVSTADQLAAFNVKNVAGRVGRMLVADTPEARETLQACYQSGDSAVASLVVSLHLADKQEMDTRERVDKKQRDKRSVGVDRINDVWESANSNNNMGLALSQRLVEKNSAAMYQVRRALDSRVKQMSGFNMMTLAETVQVKTTEAMASTVSATLQNETLNPQDGAASIVAGLQSQFSENSLDAKLCDTARLTRTIEGVISANIPDAEKQAQITDLMAQPLEEAFFVKNLSIAVLADTRQGQSSATSSVAQLMATKPTVLNNPSEQLVVALQDKAKVLALDNPQEFNRFAQTLERLSPPGTMEQLLPQRTELQRLSDSKAQKGVMAETLPELTAGVPVLDLTADQKAAVTGGIVDIIKAINDKSNPQNSRKNVLAELNKLIQTITGRTEDLTKSLEAIVTEKDPKKRQDALANLMDKQGGLGAAFKNSSVLHREFMRTALSTTADSLQAAEMETVLTSAVPDNAPDETKKADTAAKAAAMQVLNVGQIPQAILSQFAANIPAKFTVLPTIAEMVGKDTTAPALDAAKLVTILDPIKEMLGFTGPQASASLTTFVAGSLQGKKPVEATDAQGALRALLANQLGMSQKIQTCLAAKSDSPEQKKALQELKLALTEPANSTAFMAVLAKMEPAKAGSLMRLISSSATDSASLAQELQLYNKQLQQQISQQEKLSTDLLAPLPKDKADKLVDLVTDPAKKAEVTSLLANADQKIPSELRAAIVSVAGEDVGVAFTEAFAEQISTLYPALTGEQVDTLLASKDAKILQENVASEMKKTTENGIEKQVETMAKLYPMDESLKSKLMAFMTTKHDLFSKLAASVKGKQMLTDKEIDALVKTVDETLGGSIKITDVAKAEMKAAIKKLINDGTALNLENITEALKLDDCFMTENIPDKKAFDSEALKKNSQFVLTQIKTLSNAEERTALLVGLLADLESGLQLNAPSSALTQIIKDVTNQAQAKDGVFMAALSQAMQKQFSPKVMAAITQQSMDVRSSLLCAMPEATRARYDGMQPVLAEAQKFVETLPEMATLTTEKVTDMKNMSASADKTNLLSDLAKRVATNDQTLSLTDLQNTTSLLADSKLSIDEFVAILQPLGEEGLAKLEEHLAFVGLATDNQTRENARTVMTRIVDGFSQLPALPDGSPQFKTNIDFARTALSVLSNQKADELSTAVHLSRLSLHKTLQALQANPSPTTEDVSTLTHSLDTLVSLGPDTPQRKQMQEFLATLGADRKLADQKLCSLYAKMPELDKASGGKLGIAKMDLEHVMQQLGQRVSLDEVLTLAKQEPSVASALFSKLAPEQLVKAKNTLLAELNNAAVNHITNLKLIAAITALSGPDVGAPAAHVDGLDLECTEALVAEMDSLASDYLAGGITKVEYEKAAAALSADALFEPFKDDPRISAITEKVKLKSEAKILRVPEEQQTAALVEDLQKLSTKPVEQSPQLCFAYVGLLNADQQEIARDLLVNSQIVAPDPALQQVRQQMLQALTWVDAAKVIKIINTSNLPNAEIATLLAPSRAVLQAHLAERLSQTNRTVDNNYLTNFLAKMPDLWVDVTPQQLEILMETATKSSLANMLEQVSALPELAMRDTILQKLVPALQEKRPEVLSAFLASSTAKKEAVMPLLLTGQIPKFSTELRDQLLGTMLLPELVAGKTDGPGMNLFRQMAKTDSVSAAQWLQQLGSPEMQQVRAQVLESLAPEELTAILENTTSSELFQFICSEKAGLCPEAFKTFSALLEKDPNYILSMDFSHAPAVPAELKGFLENLTPEQSANLFAGANLSTKSPQNVRNILANLKSKQEVFQQMQQTLLSTHADLLVKAFPLLDADTKDAVQETFADMVSAPNITQSRRVELLQVFIGLKVKQTATVSQSNPQEAFKAMREFVLQHADDAAKLQQMHDTLTQGMGFAPNSDAAKKAGELLLLVDLLLGAQQGDLSASSERLDAVLADKQSADSFVAFLDLSALKASTGTLNTLSKLVTKVGEHTPADFAHQTVQNILAMQGLRLVQQGVQGDDAAATKAITQQCWQAAFAPSMQVPEFDVDNLPEMLQQLKTQSEQYDEQVSRELQGSRGSRATQFLIGSVGSGGRSDTINMVTQLKKNIEMLKTVLIKQEAKQGFSPVEQSSQMTDTTAVAINKNRILLNPMEYLAVNKAILVQAGLTQSQITDLLRNPEFELTLSSKILGHDMEPAEVNAMVTDPAQQAKLATVSSAENLRVMIFNVRVLAKLGVKEAQIPESLLKETQPILSAGSSVKTIADLRAQLTAPLPTNLEPKKGAQPSEQSELDAKLKASTLAGMMSTTTDADFQELALQSNVDSVVESCLSQASDLGKASKALEGTMSSINRTLKTMAKESPVQFEQTIEKLAEKFKAKLNAVENDATLSGEQKANAKMLLITAELQAYEGFADAPQFAQFTDIQARVTELSTLLAASDGPMVSLVGIIAAKEKTQSVEAMKTFETMLRGIFPRIDDLNRQKIVDALHGIDNADVRKIMPALQLMPQVLDAKNMFIESLKTQRPRTAEEVRQEINGASAGLSEQFKKLTKDDQVVFTKLLMAEISKEFTGQASEQNLHIFLAKVNDLLNLTKGLSVELNGNIKTFCQKTLEQLTENQAALPHAPEDLAALANLLSRSGITFNADNRMLKTLIKQVGVSNFQVVLNAVDNPVAAKSLAKALDQLRDEAIGSQTQQRISGEYQKALAQITATKKLTAIPEFFQVSEQQPISVEQVELLNKMLKNNPAELERLLNHKQFPALLKEAFMMSCANDEAKMAELMQLLSTKEGSAVLFNFIKAMSTRQNLSSEVQVFFNEHSQLYGDMSAGSISGFFQAFWLNCNELDLKEARKSFLTVLGGGTANKENEKAYRVGIFRLVGRCPALLESDEKLKKLLRQACVEKQLRGRGAHASFDDVGLADKLNIYGNTLHPGFEQLLESMFAANKDDDAFKNVLLTLLNQEPKAERKGKGGKYGVVVREQIAKYLATKHPEKMAAFLDVLAEQPSSKSASLPTAPEFLVFLNKSINAATRQKLLEELKDKPEYAGYLLVDEAGKVDQKMLAALRDSMDAEKYSNMLLGLEKILGTTEFRKSEAFTELKVVMEKLAAKIEKAKAEKLKEVQAEKTKQGEEMATATQEVAGLEAQKPKLVTDIAAAAPADKPALEKQLSELETSITEQKNALAEMKKEAEVIDSKVKDAAPPDESQITEMAKLMVKTSTSVELLAQLDDPQLSAGYFKLLAKKVVQEYAKKTSNQQALALVGELFSKDLVTKLNDPATKETDLITAILTPEELDSLPASLRNPGLTLTCKDLKAIRQAILAGLTEEAQLNAVAQKAKAPVFEEGRDLRKELYQVRTKMTGKTVQQQRNEFVSWMDKWMDAFARVPHNDSYNSNIRNLIQMPQNW